MFTIGCSNWIDSDGIKDYSFYGQQRIHHLRKATHLSLDFLAWITDRSTRSLVGFSASPTLNARLPPGDDHSNSTMVYLSVRVRDQYGCSFEFDIPPVSIKRDTTSVAMLINALQSSSSQLNSIEMVQLLLNGNQNEVNQVLVSLSQMLNTMSTDALQTALMNAGNISATVFSVSSLDRPWTVVSNFRFDLLLCSSTRIFQAAQHFHLGHEYDISSR